MTSKHVVEYSVGDVITARGDAYLNQGYKAPHRSWFITELKNFPKQKRHRFAVRCKTTKGSMSDNEKHTWCIHAKLTPASQLENIYE